jgi:ABC-type branched-subunit amino acid transport system ATPase component
LTEPALEIRGLNKSFGALTVADDIDFSLQPGIRHALIGPNGAGKTTFVNLITGALKPDRGTVLLSGRDITALDQAARCRQGLVRTFQISQLFQGLTPLENVCLSVAEHRGIAGSMFKPFGSYKQVIDESMHLLESFKLEPDARKTVSELAYGRQRLLEIVIALAQQPKVLLLDEPAAGVPSSESRLILDVIDELSENISILIIEHDMEIVFRFARRITVLVSGSIFTEGTPDEIASDERVRTVYLGEAFSA